MDALRAREKDCRRCKLREGCTQVVPGHGPSPAPIMFVAEAPGESEDKQGIPLVGPSGQLLDKILGAAKISRDAVYVSNCCRCRPPGNRTPEPEEVKECKHWLWAEMKLVNPLVVVALGNTPSRLLLKGGVSFRISQVVGRPQSVSYLREGGIVVPVYHPSYLLRRGGEDIEEAVKTFIKVRNYVVQKTGQGGSGAL